MKLVWGGGAGAGARASAWRAVACRSTTFRPERVMPLAVYSIEDKGLALKRGQKMRVVQEPGACQVSSEHGVG